MAATMIMTGSTVGQQQGPDIGGGVHRFVVVVHAVLIHQRIDIQVGHRGGYGDILRLCILPDQPGHIQGRSIALSGDLYLHPVLQGDDVLP